ncbi:hypothetical protein [Hwangdonia sp.]|uniref:hypothetical protein n=1 Tax=Hwangdonia sp. TaxID=1883432 RepID=UPI003AB1C136
MGSESVFDMKSLIKKTLIIFCLLTFLVSCFQVETTNPDKAYSYWAGAKPPKDIQLINGEYYQSPHFTLEYELFLEFKATEEWRQEFINYNDLKIDIQNEDWSRFTKLPEWFKPNGNYKVYSRNDEYDRSRYFIEPKSGICYIYETVGM